MLAIGSGMGAASFLSYTLDKASSTLSANYSSGDDLWALTLGIALTGALAWTCVAAIDAHRTIATSPSPHHRKRLLVTALLVIAGWSAGPGAGSSLAAATPTVSAVPAAGPVIQSPVPTPDFIADKAADSAGRCDVPEPGWTPTQPPAVEPADRTPLLMPCHTPSDQAQTVTVRRGDSLWSIAARHLGEGTNAAAIARAVPAWHNANRSVIGDDPDVLLVGQVLHVPHTLTTHGGTR